MMLNFVYVGTNSDVLLTVDTSNKDFTYWTQIKADNPASMINVKTRKDIDKIMDNLMEEHYALKI